MNFLNELEPNYSLLNPIKNFKIFSSRLISVVYRRTIDPNFEEVINYQNFLLIKSKWSKATSFQLIYPTEIWTFTVYNSLNTIPLDSSMVGIK